MKKQNQFLAKAKKFIAYFQSFTNTYKPVEELKKIYDEAIFSHPDIVGISVSTRPDCIDEEKIKLIASYRKYLPYVCIELGMQTIHNNTLDIINRKESHEDFLKAYNMIRNYNISVCAHVMIGLPNETKEMMLKTAKLLKTINIPEVKIHMTIALKNTKLAQMFKNGNWKPLELQQYIEIVSDFLEILPKTCIIHRTSGSGYPKDIIAPIWFDGKRFEIMNLINKELETRNSFQGKYFDNFI